MFLYGRQGIESSHRGTHFSHSVVDSGCEEAYFGHEEEKGEEGEEEERGGEGGGRRQAGWLMALEGAKTKFEWKSKKT